MKVFISWSGDRSLAFATALRDWLPLVINAVDPWLSAADISAGTRWNNEVARNLADSKVGIFCLTAENLDSTWLAFEAGAIAKDSSNSYACTLLLGIKPSQVKWPLAQFQAKEANKKEIFELLQTVNIASGRPLLREDYLQIAFEKWWPDLKETIDKLPASTATTPPQPRSTEDILTEILSLLRQQDRDTPPQLPAAPIRQQLSSRARISEILASTLSEANTYRDGQTTLTGWSLYPETIELHWEERDPTGTISRTKSVLPKFFLDHPDLLRLQILSLMNGERGTPSEVASDAPKT